MRAALLLVSAFTSALAQTRPDVAEILKKVSETYRAAKQYEFAVDATARESSAAKSEPTHALLAFSAPDKYRMEGTIPGMGFGNAVLIVHDGSSVWFYIPKLKQYGSIATSALTADAPGDLGDLRPEAMDHFLMSRYRRASDFANGARLLREEALDTADGKVDCYVLRVDDVDIWWVDRTNYHILREDSRDWRVTFSAVRLNEPLSDDLFKFTPPSDAQKIEMH